MNKIKTKRTIKYILTYCFVFVTCFSFSQQSKIDSLYALLKKDKEDTNKVTHLNILSWQLEKKGEYDKAMQYANNALSLSEKLVLIASEGSELQEAAIRGFAKSFFNIAAIYHSRNNYDKALENYFASLKIYKELGAKQSITAVYNNIGVIYENQGNYDKALEVYFASLKIREKTGDKQGIASSYNNIGVIYQHQSNYDKALEYYFASLKIREETGDKQGVATSYNNIGDIYTYQGNYKKALENHFASLKINEEIGDKYGIASSYVNIGTIYIEQGNYGKALEYHFASLKIDEEVGNKNGIANSYNNIGNIYLKQGKIAEAKKHSLASLRVAKEIKAKERIKETYQILSLCDSAAGNWKGAYEYHKLYKKINDSIFNDESAEKIAEMGTRYESEKKEAQIKLLEKDKEISLTESKRQRLFFWLVAAVAAAVAIIAAIIFRSLRLSQSQKRIITEQKKLVEEQKKTVDEKNKNITDSIRYAQNIQSAILPSEAEIKKALPEHFIYFQPKDIVSGDFYWFHALPPSSHEEGGPRGVVAVCDCTGHGVPGAFVSMIGNDLLNKIIIEKGVENPGEILTQLNNEVKSVFTREGEKQQAQDGMDMALCCLTPNPSPNGEGNWTLHFAGANNPLILIQNGELSVIKGDRAAIGGDTGINYTFKDNNIRLKKGDTVYMFSDGYKDQFGGDTRAGREFGEGKKFMMKRFKELLLSIHTKDMSEQKEIIQKTMTDWKGNLEQADDICVIGVRI